MIAGLLAGLAVVGATAVEQLDTPPRDLRPAQVAKPGRDLTASQLTGPARSATAPPALSRPSEGRPTRSRPIGGVDRCDPAASPAPDCDRILEQRAAEFPAVRPPPPSPEGRLLSQAQAVSSADPRRAAAAAQRGEADDSEALQAAMAAARDRQAIEDALGRSAADALLGR